MQVLMIQNNHFQITNEEIIFDSTTIGKKPSNPEREEMES